MAAICIGIGRRGCNHTSFGSVPWLLFPGGMESAREKAFDVLPDSVHRAVGQRNGIGSSPVLITVLGGAASYGDGLTIIIDEI
jgi:hypothetical protein